MAIVTEEPYTLLSFSIASFDILVVYNSDELHAKLDSSDFLNAPLEAYVSSFVDIPPDKIPLDLLDDLISLMVISFGLKPTDRYLVLSYLLDFYFLGASVLFSLIILSFLN